jgi:mycothiol synthase
VKLPQGYTARPASLGDLDGVAALWDTWDLAYFGEFENANRAALQYEWAAPWVDLERDTRMVLAGDGALVAYVSHVRRDPGDRFEVGIVVHPDHEGRGIGTALTRWTEEKSRSQLAPEERLPLWAATGAPNEGGLRLLHDHGYRHIRTFWQMLLELDRGFEAGEAPPGVVVRRNVAGRDDRAGHDALEEAFADHFGWVPEPFEVWWARNEAEETFDASLGIVAEVDGEIVGASVNGIIEGVGWVYELGVRSAFQRRGIGRALLRRTMAMFADRGLATARLGVDTENATGALDLYRSIGMRPVREWRLFEKTISREG